MPVYVVTSLKGGVGKTTSAMFLATISSWYDRETVLIDADEEGSSLSWAAHAEDLPFKVVKAERDGLLQQVKAYKDKGLNVFIDTPPNNREVLSRSSMIADYIIVPIIPTGLDIDRMMPGLLLLKDIQAVKEVEIVILLNRFDNRKRLAQEALAALDAYPVLNSKIRDLTRYEQSFGTTPTYIFEYLRVWTELHG